MVSKKPTLKGIDDSTIIEPKFPKDKDDFVIALTG